MEFLEKEKSLIDGLKEIDSVLLFGVLVNARKLIKCPPSFINCQTQHFVGNAV